jgi:cytochrome c oxidase subunit II
MVGVPPRRGSRARPGRWAGGLLCATATVALTGCGGNENVLRPEAKPAHSIDHLWWWMMTFAWIGFGLVCTLLFLGWLRRNRTELPFGGGEKVGTVLVISLGIAMPLVLLTALFFWSNVSVLKSTAAPAPGSTRRTIRVVAHQWWWEARYVGTKAVTANEIHIPVGVPVEVIGTTADVIHSFWIPQLNRKIDLIPGRENRLLLQADRTGVFRGECSEFCGLQHAHMTATVVAEPPEAFRAWLANMSRPARRPSTPQQRRGQTVFLSQACSGCHQIRGTDAHAHVGPDLTHLQTRRTLASGTIPNDTGYLAGWIADPQHYKPGNAMPQIPLGGTRFGALLAYLESLE